VRSLARTKGSVPQNSILDQEYALCGTDPFSEILTISDGCRSNRVTTSLVLAMRHSIEGLGNGSIQSHHSQFLGFDRGPTRLSGFFIRAQFGFEFIQSKALIDHNALASVRISHGSESTSVVHLVAGVFSDTQPTGNESALFSLQVRIASPVMATA